jgi:hypothetical protein
MSILCKQISWHTQRRAENVITDERNGQIFASLSTPRPSSSIKNWNFTVRVKGIRNGVLISM